MCLFFVAVQAAFQQAVADIDHAIQRLETGLQNGLYLLTMSSLWGLQEVTARMYKTCMRVHHKHFMPVVWPQVGHSVYAVGEYPPEILARATEIVNRSMWPEFPAKGPALMYACRGPFYRWNLSETDEMASVLKAALEVARSQGRFLRLEHLCRKGQDAWRFPFLFDGGQVGKYEFWYEKTAGDAVCTFWIKKHMEHSGQNWLGNMLQAAFVTWAGLPYRVLSQEMARHVSGFGTHALGDFQEILALYLSEELLNLYMNVSALYLSEELPNFYMNWFIHASATAHLVTAVPGYRAY